MSAENRRARNQENLAALPAVAEVAGPIARAIYELHYAADALGRDLAIANDLDDCAAYAAWVVQIADIVAGVVDSCTDPGDRRLAEQARRIVYAIADVDEVLSIAGRERSWVVAGEFSPWARYRGEDAT